MGCVMRIARRDHNSSYRVIAMRTFVLIAFLFPFAGLQAQQKPLSFSLTLKPAGEDDGPVRQTLLPSFRDRTGGNAAVDYLRAVVFRELATKAVVKYEAEFDKALE